MSVIDKFLDGITMYRLVLYYLIFLIAVSTVYSFVGILSFNPFSLLFSTLFLVIVCYLTNTIFAKVFEVPTNVESVYITVLILALIINPIQNPHDIVFLFWAGIWAMASKYMFAMKRKHIFNPAAFALALTSVTISQGASWWIGTMSMLPFTVLGFLIVRKIRRFDLVFYFFITSLATILVLSMLKGSDLLSVLQKTIVDSPILFFAFVMLTEPLTTPPTKLTQAIYGALVGVLFVPQLQIGSLYTTPETALLFGNIFSYIVSPKEKLLLHLKEKIQLGPDITSFIFGLNKKIAFLPGQYMEWTLSHTGTDSRGNRRYFTLASSPTEDTIQLGVKFYPNGSSYKRAMLAMNNKTPIVAGQLAGDFTLPVDPNKKVVFIAGGIGITPFRSIIKYLLDTNQKRDIVFLYSNRYVTEIAYKDIFDQAQTQLGIRTIYSLTDATSIPQNWQGRIGRVDATMIHQEIPDFKERLFYLSGPHQMVSTFEDILKGMGISSSQIKVDFFPGFV